MSKVSITHVFRQGLKLGGSEEGSDEEEEGPKPRVLKNIKKLEKKMTFRFFSSELVPMMLESCFEVFGHLKYL